VRSAKINDFLTGQGSGLQPEHLQVAVRLPSGHVVRKLFAEATVMEFFRFELGLWWPASAGCRISVVSTCQATFRSCQKSVFPLALLHGATFSLLLHLTNHSNPALRSLLDFFNSLSQQLSRNLPVLGSGSGGLYFDDRSCGQVF
jgi:hypothetical protein